jgi:hypothetical protein
MMLLDWSFVKDHSVGGRTEKMSGGGKEDLAIKCTDWLSLANVDIVLYGTVILPSR